MGWAQMVQGGINIGTALIQGRQQANELRTQAEIEGRNIELAKANRDIVNRQYSAREESMRRSARQALGAQRAAIAQSGTGFSGSNLDIMKQSTANAELDALNLRYAGQIEDASMQNDITMREWNKANLRRAAKNTMKMRWHNAGAALFGANQVSGTNANGGITQTSTPTLASGSYGQGSAFGFGNNVDNFSGSNYGLSSGFGSINKGMGFTPGSSGWSKSTFGSGFGGSY